MERCPGCGRCKECGQPVPAPVLVPYPYPVYPQPPVTWPPRYPITVTYSQQGVTP